MPCKVKFQQKIVSRMLIITIHVHSCTLQKRWDKYELSIFLIFVASIRSNVNVISFNLIIDEYSKNVAIFCLNL